MLDEFLPWAFRLVGAFLVVWAVATVLCLALRRIGVIPYPPFASRQEYLTAALEMDLEEFIERAKVTPESVKRKEVPITPAGIGQREIAITPAVLALTGEVSKLFKDPTGLASEARRDRAEQAVALDTALTVDTTLSGSLGFPGAAITGLIAGAGLVNPVPKTSMRLDEKLARKFPLDRWFRSKQGELVRVVATLSGVITCACDGGIKSFLPKDLEPAAPRDGEWWRWTKEKLLDGFCARNLEPFNFSTPESGSGRYSREVEAGNLEPVNFGRSNSPAQSDRSSKFKVGQWVRYVGKRAERILGDVLMQVEQVRYMCPEGLSLKTKYGPVVCSDYEVEPAYPKVGEWWCWSWSLNQTPFTWFPANGDEWASHVQDGDLVPVNFGKGEEKNQA